MGLINKPAFDLGGNRVNICWSQREAGVRGQTPVDYYTASPVALERLLCAPIPGERRFPNLQTLICTLRAEGPGGAGRNPGHR